MAVLRLRVSEVMEHEPVNGVMWQTEGEGACGEAPMVCMTQSRKGADGQVLKEGKHFFQIIIVPVEWYCYIKCRTNWDLEF